MEEINSARLTHATSSMLGLSMRIVGGTHRGRRLHCPSGRSVRPTPDRVREALFSILGDRVPDTSILDLFSGTGALGLEAISRGAQHVTFVENGRQSLPHLQKNLAFLAEEQFRLLPISTQRALPQLKGLHFDLIFMDPPYGKNLIAQTLNHIQRKDLVTKEDLIVCEHESRLPDDTWPAQWTIKDQRCWGEVSITMLVLSGGA